MAYVTTAQFKTFTNITSTDASRDTFIDVLIARAELIVNKYCDVETFEANPTTVKLVEHWDYKEWLFLPAWKVASITSIVLYDLDSDNALSYTFTSSDWYLDTNIARIKNIYVSIHNYEIRVVYTPVVLPVDITEATLEIALRMWNDSNRGRSMFDVTSKDIVDESIQVFNNNPLPRNVKFILDQYKRWSL